MLSAKHIGELQNVNGKFCRYFGREATSNNVAEGCYPLSGSFLVPPQAGSGKWDFFLNSAGCTTRSTGGGIQMLNIFV